MFFGVGKLGISWSIIPADGLRGNPEAPEASKSGAPELAEDGRRGNQMELDEQNQCMIRSDFGDEPMNPTYILCFVVVRFGANRRLHQGKQPQTIWNMSYIMRLRAP